MFSTFKIFYLFVYFIFGCAGSSLLCELFSSCSKWGLLSSGSVQAYCCDFSCEAQALGHVGCRSFSTWAQQLWLPGSKTQARQLWFMSLVALQHEESSQSRDWTYVSCTGKQIRFFTESPGKPPKILWWIFFCKEKVGLSRK